MALISSTTIITSISLFHLTLAYFFLFKPKTVADQAIVFVLGESMNMPEVRGFDVPSPALALLSVILAFSGISDLVSLSMPEEFSAFYYWGTQAPLRFFLSMLLVAYSYAFGPSRPNTSYKASGSGTDHLHNRLLFAFMFVEMMAWFWTWITLREERSVLVEKMRKQEERERQTL
ncbi:increased loss of mitochondrial DNA protein 1 domain-containing protein [Trichoderma breve]|uniref:Increased loss of mitochondrial DNA protein 1 domain-containing protein n=1 Tax=Trichoderma breve TaxID=2034170 RepID=A0A9W9E1T2_9HYPO|nr:increased loss of mitochondrial DNA protein 1 domain-containing protein [Trichoderma breve]KAJ4855003.1 increased loss of mitochondrial DNA protein 1 domain-containing protein [Trichoderma breve]